VRVARLGAGASARRVLGILRATRVGSRSPLRMHRVFFDLKRAYHSTLRLTRRLLKRLGLTAARFDLLYIVEKAGKTMLQCDLRRALGVTAPTVSRMVSSLQALGLVEREVVDLDRRRREVTLTKAGLRCVRRAARHLIHSGWVELAVDSALCPQRWFNAEESSRARGVLSTTLNRLRYAYGDRATRDYPSFYDEDFEEEDITPLRSWLTEADE
jgi:DNA-binding MarR family transcriptional regulator